MSKGALRLIFLLGFLSVFCLRSFHIWFAISLFIGGIVGFYFEYIEGVVSILLSVDVRKQQELIFSLIKKGKLGDLANLIEESIPKQSLIHSWLFVLIYIVMGFFVMTSTRSWLGEGMILGLGFHYLLDFLIYRNDSSYLLTKYGQIDKDLLAKLPIIFSIIFLIFSLLGLRFL